MLVGGLCLPSTKHWRKSYEKSTSCRAFPDGKPWLCEFPGRYLEDNPASWFYINQCSPNWDSMIFTLPDDQLLAIKHPPLRFIVSLMLLLKTSTDFGDVQCFKLFPLPATDHPSWSLVKLKPWLRIKWDCAVYRYHEISLTLIYYIYIIIW